MNVKTVAQEPRVGKLGGYCNALTSNFASLTARQQYTTTNVLIII
jgi:hypothetical protein